MGKAFENIHQSTVDATPEQVWDAIATGPGIESWFVGRHEVLPGPDGTVRMRMGAFSPDMPITAWDEPRRLAYRTDEAPDGRFLAYEFLVEGRAGGSTVLRSVTSGFLPGDDWAEEYEAMTLGTALFFATLVEYLRHFAGRAATKVSTTGPPVADWAATWAGLHRELGLPDSPGVGDRGSFVPPGGAGPVEAVVYFRNAHTLGLRAPDAFYRFVRGLHGPMVVEHELFAAGVDGAAARRAWRSWLARVPG